MVLSRASTRRPKRNAPGVAVLRSLRSPGVRLALDDFGTGYSSLASLQRLPVDTLKIDRAFIAELATDRRNLEICRSIAMMAKTLRLEVTAEGIGTSFQATLARCFLCDRAQGYFFSRPLPPEQFAERVLTTLAPLVRTIPVRAGRRA